MITSFENEMDAERKKLETKVVGLKERAARAAEIVAKLRRLDESKSHTPPEWIKGNTTILPADEFSGIIEVGRNCREQDLVTMLARILGEEDDAPQRPELSDAAGGERQETPAV